MFYDLIIIGGGPAGITAGIYAARKKLKTLLLTKDFVGEVGKTGQIENYPGFPSIVGLDLMGKFKEHLKKYEVEIQEGEKVVKVEKPKKAEKTYRIATENGKEFFAKTVIIATGRVPRQLHIPGEKEFIGHGLSYCSICDAPFFKDKSVVVVGGGNSGLEAVLDLDKYAKRIFILERSNKLPGDELLQEQMKKVRRVQVHLNKELKEIGGSYKVEYIVYRDSDTGKTFQLPIDGVFVHIGLTPAADFLKGLVELTKDGAIKVDPKTFSASLPGIFAAGDVNDGKWKQIVIAAGQGCQAALAAYDYLQK